MIGAKTSVIYISVRTIDVKSYYLCIVAELDYSVASKNMVEDREMKHSFSMYSEKKLKNEI